MATRGSVRLCVCFPIAPLLSAFLPSSAPDIPPLPAPPSPLHLPPPSTIDSFDCGRWWQSVVCHEIIVSSLALGWALHSPPLLIYLLMWCVTCSTLKRESRGGLNNCRAVPHRLARVVSGWGWWGGGALRGQSAALRIHMWNQWNGRLISRGMRAGSTYTCSLGYSSKSMAWFYFCIDWKDCAALTVWGTRHQILHFFVSLGDVLFGSLVLFTIATDWNQPAEFNISFTDEQTLS